MIALFLQIGELFDGKFNWRGVFHLSAFVLLGLIAVSFAVWISYRAFKPKKNNKNDF